MSYVDILDSEMRASGDEPAFAGGADEKIISEFEVALGLKFPETYKLFLRKYGALSFAGDTYYGITRSGLDATAVPSVVFATRSARSFGDADESMIVIKASGYGPIYSIDTSITGRFGEPAIVETELSFKQTKEKKIINQSFEEFFSLTVRDAINNL